MRLFKETKTERWLTLGEITARGYTFYLEDQGSKIYNSPTRAQVYYALGPGQTKARQVMPQTRAWTNAARTGGSRRKSLKK